METTLTQPQMLGATDPNSPIPTKVLDSGGKFNSTKDTGLEKSESLTEETAVETDLQEQRFMLTINSVDKFKAVPEMVNGMMSHAQNQCLVKRLDLLQLKIHTYQSQDSKHTQVHQDQLQHQQLHQPLTTSLQTLR